MSEMMRLILTMAPSFQGGHSKTGAEVAKFLGIRFPLQMSTLERAAKERGFDVNELWPWLAQVRGKSPTPDAAAEPVKADAP